MSGDTVGVRIFGEPYQLRTGEDPAYVEEIAAHVDRRMREVAAAGKVVATDKVAVLAALHLADELFRLRRETEHEREETERRVSRLLAELDLALGAEADAPPPAR